MAARHSNVPFLCTGNSARSIMAEAILNKKGFPNFTAYSAGSHPTGRMHLGAIRQIEAAGIPAVELRSKSGDEFARPGVPEMHFVFTVCDSAPEVRRQQYWCRWLSPGIPDSASEVVVPRASEEPEAARK